MFEFIIFLFGINRKIIFNGKKRKTIVLIEISTSFRIVFDDLLVGINWKWFVLYE